ncbi:hypothetical protein CI1B_27710 [Bradyrhizobium ivorense]|uniref:Uncharacterized protein n=1 Tax=Bradyrhizobium ivorense TaxID=2511166 RepID=A0A508T2J9_9BRAD|nr:hypothetical protein [Bradyrhizobium ivorense]VIO69565.1 hypothetical protein CI1B_27710 [Bradyrhizobium ivorense]VIO71311.1 hypothetical protein CI41S_29820 [Bradyrhizobium ivorense]
MSFNGFFDGIEPEPQLAAKHGPFHGIIRLNFNVMRENAFYLAYGFKVPTTCMVVVDVLLNMELLQEETNAANLKKRVGAVIERKNGAALEAIKLTLHKQMIAYQQVGTKKIFGMSVAQKTLSETVSRHMQPIADVLLAQMANPRDPVAGSALVDPKVYFNAISQY